jgi:hypothetical protein
MPNDPAVRARQENEGSYNTVWTSFIVAYLQRAGAEALQLQAVAAYRAIKLDGDPGLSASRAQPVL